MKNFRLFVFFFLIGCNPDKNSDVIHAMDEVDFYASYVEGDSIFYAYLSNEIFNPNFSKIDTIFYQVDFVVNELGYFESLTFHQSFSPEFDSLISKILINTQPWIPARLENENVSVLMRLPFAFPPKAVIEK